MYPRAKAESACSAEVHDGSIYMDSWVSQVSGMPVGASGQEILHGSSFPKLPDEPLMQSVPCPVDCLTVPGVLRDMG